MREGGDDSLTQKLKTGSQKSRSLNFLAIFRLPSPEPVGFPDGGGEIESTVSQSTLSNLN